MQSNRSAARHPVLEKKAGGSAIILLVVRGVTDPQGLRFEKNRLFRTSNRKTPICAQRGEIISQKDYYPTAINLALKASMCIYPQNPRNHTPGP